MSTENSKLFGIISYSSIPNILDFISAVINVAVIFKKYSIPFETALVISGFVCVQSIFTVIEKNKVIFFNHIDYKFQIELFLSICLLLSSIYAIVKKS